MFSFFGNFVQIVSFSRSSQLNSEYPERLNLPFNFWAFYGKRLATIRVIICEPHVQTESERAVQENVARSDNQSERAISRVLPAQKLSHILTEREVCTENFGYFLRTDRASEVNKKFIVWLQSSTSKQTLNSTLSPNKLRA